jgi:hypothetical protein
MIDLVAAIMCGVLIGAAVVYLWLVWYFRDAMK